MLLELVFPHSIGTNGTARIDAVNFAEGQMMARNAPLIDFTTGLDDAAKHDCPPVTTYRMTLSETAWVRQINVAAGQTVELNQVIALLSTKSDDPLDSAPERRCRIATAAIIQPLAW